MIRLKLFEGSVCWTLSVPKRLVNTARKYYEGIGYRVVVSGRC